MTVWFDSLSLLTHQASALGINPADTEFVDVGAGAGFAAIYAVEEMHYACAIAIDYDAARVGEAKDNLATSRLRKTTRERISFVHADAATWVLPPRRVKRRFYFIFNAFGERTLEAFIGNNLRDFTSKDAIGLANDVALLGPAVGLLPGSDWLRRDAANCTLVLPSRHSEASHSRTTRRRT